MTTSKSQTSFKLAVLLSFFVTSWLTTPPREGQAADTVANAVADADRIVHTLWKAQDVAAAQRCTDGEFLRRVTLDLWGRIPTPKELKAFLAEPKRDAKVGAMLESEEFSEFWASVTTAQWCGYQRSVNSDREVLRLWMQSALQQRTPYDELARQVIAAEGASAAHGPVNFLLRHLDEPAVKISRVFLGVRLDCARCHDHPFDRWTEDDYEQMQRFFSATRRTEISEGNQRLESVEPQGLDNPPRFLTGARPRSSRWRDEFALFATKSKPFARTFANRMWYHFLGRGIVHPIDDFSQANPPVSRELLERLAHFARQSHYDIRAMCRLICATDAYQRSSEAVYSPHDPKSELAQHLFAVRVIKPLTAEQHLGAIETALGVEFDVAQRRGFFQAFIGETLDEDFSRLWEHRETQQALMTRLGGKGPAIGVHEDSVDELYLRFLSRRPSERERRLCQRRPSSDLTFALLHCHEFCLNH